jgi:hypothetical protein
VPFTPSHAVVALPFVRTPLVPAAIAIGAMAPDLPLFVRGLPLHYGLTHSFAWLPVTMVLALLLLLIWRCVLRPAARELSPAWLASRLPAGWDAAAAASLRETFTVRLQGSRPDPDPAQPAQGPSWRGVLILVASLGIGVLTHIVWDLFTHEGRWGVEALPALQDAWGPLTGFRWLQHGSSVLGIAILAGWAIPWLRRRDAAPVGDRVLPAWVRWAWWLSLPTILVVAWVVGLWIFGPFSDDWTLQHLAYRVLPSASAVWGVITLVLAVAVQVLRNRRRTA